MQKTALFAAMFWTASGFCQTPVKEPDTLQALLVEVHQLRLDIEAMTVASQRVQIALYSLQMQDAAVARSAQRLDSAHGRCIGADGDRQHTAADIQGLESTLASATVPQDQQAEAVKQRLKELKNRLDVQTAAVQTCQADEAEASAQLRNDQARLLDLQERIEGLNKALEQFGKTGK
jgi:DNA repair exonuclease SbcCD ATPase subunit